MYATRILLVFVLFASACSDTHALTVQIPGTGAPPFPVFNRVAGDTTSFTLAAQLTNETSSAQSLSLWQLGLVVTPDSLATGDVKLTAIASPATPLFEGPGPGVNPPTTLPSDSAFIQDADVPPAGLPGKTILANEARSIVELDFAGSLDASGTFYLTLASLDPFEGSVWYDELGNPQSFENEINLSALGKIVLAQINFAVPEPASIMIVAASLISLVSSRLRHFSY